MSYKASYQTRSNRIEKSIIAMLIIGIGSFSGQVSASNCKGLDNNTCSANASCSWVDSYQRKDGRNVNAFCRTKPSGKTSKASQGAKNSASTEANKTKLATGA